MSKNKKGKHNSDCAKTKKDQTTVSSAYQASTQVVSAQLSQPMIEQRLIPNPLNEFSMDENALRLALITAQFALRATRRQDSVLANQPTGLLVLVNGMEQAGKGSAVKQLREWVDPRLLKVEATIGHSSLPYQPIWQAHIKAIPRHGDVMVYFGNWYADLLHDVMRIAAESHEQDSSSDKSEKVDNTVLLSTLPTTKWQNFLEQHLHKLDIFEQDLIANHTKVLKCWFHIDADTLKERLNDAEADPLYLYQIDWHNVEVLNQFNSIAASLLRQQGDWIIIDGSDKSQAATSFCHEVLDAMQKALISSESSLQPTTEKDSHAETQSANKSKSATNPQTGSASTIFAPVDIPKNLTHIKEHELKKSAYKDKLADKQAEFAALIRARKGRHVVFAFEGMDAAGKGGAIKRIVAPLDPREYQIYNISAPMLYELQHPYLWRFWTKLPNEQTDRISRIGIFDRTWYGRVLVERVEGFAKPDEWQRAYNEINRFEADLSEAGTLVIKYWLAIDKAEQLERFKSRDETAHKQFKLTDDDWRNRDKWDDYVQAAADMLARTDTDEASWCVIATNDKRHARLQVLDHAIQQLKKYN